jgi:hypothetical protein
MAKKIKVVLSNNEVVYCTRPWYYSWMFDGIGSSAFIGEDGKKIKIGNHWWIYQQTIDEKDIPNDKRKYSEGN